MNNYSFYISFPINNTMIDFNNPKHIKLLQYMQELESLGTWVTYTKSQTNKARRLIKSALGESGECSIHSIDLSFRKCKYDTMQANEQDLANNCSWVSATSIEPPYLALV